jgi:hypothetical protein
MGKIIVVALAGLAVSLGACTKAEQAKTNDNIHDAASDVAQAGHEVANSPAVEKAGENLKEAAHDTGTVLKDAAKGAVSGAKEGMAKAEGDQVKKGDGVENGGHTTTTTTTTTVETKKN